MKGSSESAGGSDAEVVQPWQQRTIDRRLSTARARALARSSRFLAAALEIVEESGRADFTVQTLIDRSNLSLRAFYQHFAGKEELLLALYENVTTQFTEDIRHEVGQADGPLEKLEAFCRGFLSRAESSEAAGGRAVTIYHLSLEVEHPDHFAKVWDPLQKLLTKTLTDCAASGLVRTDLTPAQVSALLSSTLTALAQIGMLRLDTQNVKLTEDQMWAWCRQAVSPPTDTEPAAAQAEPEAAPAASKRSRGEAKGAGKTRSGAAPARRAKKTSGAARARAEQ
ncbi:TetR/AcrR family transcriptional regulator [Nocardia vaccinii]|uniref:TetR/AcrR family transcriptional regulator n=1 Tax=Nocardia vaccinii TaxID=1822 RepID=UPI0008358F26|nr:TetR/AcrR family transcriptional regulator [Nocardia vaccinii]